MQTLPIFENLSWLKANFYNADESTKITDVVCMKQPHFADVVWLNHPQTEWLDCDAIATNQTGIKLTVRTADCAPILIADTEQHLIAAVHAGWKSAVQGLIENTVHALIQHGADPKNMIAGIGPHLQIQSFEVSPEMKALFPPVHQHFFTQENGQILFDFDAYVQMRLRHAGINQIQSTGTDTFTGLTYNSYRRDPNNPARQFSIIEIKEA